MALTPIAAAAEVGDKVCLYAYLSTGKKLIRSYIARQTPTQHVLAHDETRVSRRDGRIRGTDYICYICDAEAEKLIRRQEMVVLVQRLYAELAYIPIRDWADDPGLLLDIAAAFAKRGYINLRLQDTVQQIERLLVAG